MIAAAGLSMACTRADHAALKASLSAFRFGTTPAGVQEDEHGRPLLELGHCVRCRSTLAYDRDPDRTPTPLETYVTMSELVNGADPNAPTYVDPEKTPLQCPACRRALRECVCPQQEEE